MSAATLPGREHDQEQQQGAVRSAFEGVEYLLDLFTTHFDALRYLNPPL